MYLCRHFKLQELVPPDVFNARGVSAWELLDPSLLFALDCIRDKYGPILVNNWHSGGELKYRAFRPSDCKVGATYSQHRYGRAADITPLEADLTAVYKALCEAEIPGVTTVENIEATPTWIHLDVRNGTAVRVVNP